MQSKSTEKKELLIIMTAGCLLGILCFAMVYGFKIVNPTYDDWIFYGDMDLKQHYVGFCHFRNTPWRFPIGLIDSLSVPYSMSIVYTDSIPLFAIIFKLFRNVLPVHFQYFGIFGLISFMLMGMLSPVLIRRFCKNRTVCIFGSLFFVLSYPVLQRMFYHTALSAQWIIVLALIIWFYTDVTDNNQIRKICIYWSLLGVLSVLIHSYFVFMTGLILLAQTVDGILKSWKDINDKWKEFMPIVCMGISSFSMLYILGGFYGAGSVSGDGFGSFDANLSALINPLTFSRIFNGFELYGMFEFEGFAYLGLGIILICLIGIGYRIYVKYIEKSNIVESFNNVECMDNKTKWIVATLAIICFMFACFPNYTFGDIKLFSVPLPGFVKSILGVCRTNARFAWIPMYLIIASSIWFIGSQYSKNWAKFTFAAAVVLQLFELSSTAKDFNRVYTSEYKYESVWSDLQDEINGKSQFVFMYDDSDIMMDTAFMAYLNNMSQNSFYFARTIYDEIDAEIDRWSDEFINGSIDNDVVYIFRNEDYSDKYKSAVKRSQAKEYSIDGHVVIVSK